MAKIQIRQCPPATRPYIIRQGDTLYGLARRFGTTVEGIVQANTGIDPNNLQIGQRVCIPVSTPVCPEGNPYTVRSGDSLYRIARFFNISLDDLVEANPMIDPANIVPGQVICIPLATPPVTCKAGETPYVVRAGDTFTKIALQFNVDVDDLMAANANIHPMALLVGQTICIPRTWNTYRNPEYQVTFRYPANWRRVDDLRYEGSDGFFQISAIASLGDLTTVCRSEAYQQLMPYGSEPQISRTQIAGQEACFIFPSADQPTEMRDQSALIIRYPSPVQIEGVAYNYFILWADRDFIRDMASSVRFIT